MTLFRRRRAAEDERLADARRDLAAVERQWPDVRRAVAAMVAHSERNHFADTILTIFRGERR